jgi:hypothetical protein
MGDLGPGDASHSVMWAAASSCRALRSRDSRSGPGGSWLARLAGLWLPGQGALRENESA